MSDQSQAGGAHLDNAVARWTLRALTVLVSVVMFAMMMLTTVDVAGRAFFNAPMKGSFEIVTFMLGILVFAAFPLITWDQKHITVNLFDRWIPQGVKRVLDVVLSLVSTLIVAAIAYRLWIQADLMAEGQHVTGFLEWPIAPVVYFMAATSVLAAVILAVITWQKLTGRTRPGSTAGRWESSGVE